VPTSKGKEGVYGREVEGKEMRRERKGGTEGRRR